MVIIEGGKGKRRRSSGWYAAMCRTSREVPKIGVRIAALGAPVMIAKAYRWEKQGKWMVAVDAGLLFPPFLFFKMKPPGPWRNLSADDLWTKVAQVRGLGRIMGCRDRQGDPVPIPIPMDEWKFIQDQQLEGERKEKTDRFKHDQTVTVVDGPFSSFDGVFDKPVGERVRIFLNLFGQRTAVELDEEQIRAA